MTSDPKTYYAMKAALLDLRNAQHLRAPPHRAAISELKIAPYEGVVNPAPPIDLDQISARVVEQFSRGALPGRRDLQHCAFCVWETKVRLVDRPPAFANYLKHIEKGIRKAEYRRLAEAYVRAFDPRSPGLSEAAATLANTASRAGGAWMRRAEEYHLFDPIRGPSALAERALNQDTEPVNYLHNRDGMPDSLARAGFARASWKAGLALIQKEAQNENERSRFERLKQWNGTNERALLFEEDKAIFVQAIVAPYRKAGPSDKAIRDEMLNYLLGILGDPRLKPDRWVGLDEAKGPRGLSTGGWSINHSASSWML
jgi:hypothetical protein